MEYYQVLKMWLEVYVIMRETVQNLVVEMCQKAELYDIDKHPDACVMHTL